jgi:hypothetical protein
MSAEIIGRGLPGPLILVLPSGYRLIVQQEQELQAIAFLVTGFRRPGY